MAHYDLKGRVVAITGSTGGLGSAVAKALIAKGARLALFDLDGAATAAQARALGDDRQAHGWAVDVSSLASLKAAMDETARHFGGIDVTIANAGITAVESILTADTGRFERVIDVNLNGVWRTFRAALPHVQSRQGYLMAISSMAAFVHSPMQASYAASKAGVWAMCDSIRLELRHLRVGVGSVHPTFFPTPMMDVIHTDPVANRIWRGNKSGIWKMVSLESVVDAIVRGIEAREDMIAVPKQNGLVARMPGLLRKIIERIGFTDDEIAQMIRLAAEPTRRAETQTKGAAL
jgi:NAD(P)-dependent dehydrogenase (short-subunit alcohol dehydrogenase family)